MFRTLFSALILVVLAAPVITRAQTPAQDREPDLSQYAERRSAAMRALPDGVLLLHARPDVKDFRESGFHQNVDFFYFTGIDDVTNAIAAIDGVRQESWLFLPTDVAGMPSLVGTTMRPGPQAKVATGFDHVVGWNDFAEFIDRRLEGKLYVPGELSGSSTNPSGMSPVGDPDVLWLHSIGLRWPEANLESAAATIRVLRMTKDNDEIAALRRAGATSVEALLAALGAVGPGVSQRTAEGAVIAACLSAGADGISFWPWVMAGPNAVFPTPLATTDISTGRCRLENSFA